MVEHRKAKLLTNTNIQPYSELYNKLHEDVFKKLSGRKKTRPKRPHDSGQKDNDTGVVRK